MKKLEWYYLLSSGRTGRKSSSKLWNPHEILSPQGPLHPGAISRNGCRPCHIWPTPLSTRLGRRQKYCPSKRGKRNSRVISFMETMTPFGRRTGTRKKVISPSRPSAKTTNGGFTSVMTNGHHGKNTSF